MTVTVEGVPIYLLERGSGLPTLMLHGNPDSADMWLPLIGEALTALTTPASMRRALRQAAPRLPDEYFSTLSARYSAQAKWMALRLYRAGDPVQFVGWEDRLLQLTARVPTLVIWGDQDPFAPSSLADRFGAQQVAHYADYSHWVLIENAAVVAERLQEFLS